MMRCNNRNKSRKVTPRSSQFGESSCSFETQWRTERSAGRPRSQAGFSNRLNQSRLLFCPTCLFSSLPLFLIPSPSHHRSSPLVRGVIGRKNVGLATSLVSLHFPAPNAPIFYQLLYDWTRIFLFLSLSLWYSLNFVSGSTNRIIIPFRSYSILSSVVRRMNEISKYHIRLSL